MASDFQSSAPQFFSELADAARADHAAVLSRLASSPDGLSWTDARRRLERFGRNELTSQRPPSWLVVLWGAGKHPFNGVLAALGGVSFLTGDLKAAIVKAFDEAPTKAKAAFDKLSDGKDRAFTKVDAQTYEPVVELIKFVDQLRKQKS